MNANDNLKATVKVKRPVSGGRLQADLNLQSIRIKNGINLDQNQWDP